MIYLTGIDTLVVGFYISEFNLTDEDWTALSNAKEKAKATVFKSSGSLTNFKGLDFVMWPSGKRPYTYILQHNDFSLLIAKKVFNNKTPEVYVELRSQFLWGFGYKKAYSSFRDWLSGWAVIKSDVVSRADLTVDISGFPSIKIKNIISCARNKKKHFQFEPIKDGEIYYYGSRETGWRIGSGHLMLRIYDKPLEIKTKSHKEWFYDLWKRAGWDGETDIARVEMQLRRNFLKEYGVTTFQSFQDALGDIYRYVTQEWFTLRKPSSDKNRARWALTPFWSEVQRAINNFGEIYGQIRGQIKEPKLGSLIPQAAGLISSIGALMGDFAWQDVKYEIDQHLRKKGSNLEDLIAEKRKRQGMFEDLNEPF